MTRSMTAAIAIATLIAAPAMFGSQVTFVQSAQAQTAKKGFGKKAPRKTSKAAPSKKNTKSQKPSSKAWKKSVFGNPAKKG